MANITAYKALEKWANANYSQRFDYIENIPKPDFWAIGEGISRANGEEKYLTSLTPIQSKKAVAVSILAGATLISAGVIIAAILMKNHFVYLGLLGSGTCLLGSGIATIYYYNQLDLDSPKQRKIERGMILTHQFSLSQINARYGNFAAILDYELLGSFKRNTYQEMAHLCKKQEEADHTYEILLSGIKKAYHDASEPARQSLARAEDAEFTETLTSKTETLEEKARASLRRQNIAYNLGHARAEYDATIRELKPLYDQAFHNLQLAYRKATRPLESSFRNLFVSK